MLLATYDSIPTFFDCHYSRAIFGPQLQGNQLCSEAILALLVQLVRSMNKATLSITFIGQASHKLQAKKRKEQKREGKKDEYSVVFNLGYSVPRGIQP